MNIRIRSMLAIALLMASFQVNAQCDCDQVIESTQQFYVTYSAQFIDIVNHNDGTATTTYEMCVYNMSFEGTIKRWTCGANTYCSLESFGPSGTPPSKICRGVDQGPDGVEDKLRDIYGDFQDHYRQNMSCDPMQGQMFTVNGGCKAIVDVAWPSNAFCTNGIIGENASGPVRGTVFPPATMTVPCQTSGCCTVDGLGNKDGSGISCGNIDATRIRWDGPCGTFFGAVTAIQKPCTPTCGDDMNLYKMAGTKTNTSNDVLKENFFKSLGETSKNNSSYYVWLTNQGNTLNVNSLKDVKQINILDISGRKNIEYKNVDSKAIDISALGKGLYLVQFVKTDNTTMPSIKLQK